MVDPMRMEQDMSMGKCELEEWITILGFCAFDMMLYLDTHPSDRNAMESFNHYARIKTQMEREFSKEYYPLRKDLAESSCKWRWGDAPLPWEGGCD